MKAVWTLEVEMVRGGRLWIAFEDKWTGFAHRLIRGRREFRIVDESMAFGLSNWKDALTIYRDKKLEVGSRTGGHRNLLQDLLSWRCLLDVQVEMSGGQLGMSPGFQRLISAQITFQIG